MMTTIPKPHATSETPPQEKPTPRKTSGWSGLIVAILLVGGAIGAGIYFGILSRLHEEKTLQQAASTGEITYVSVVHPKPTEESTELSLPGNVEAFISTPIFARTNGYLKKWYFDIGAHVKQNDLLAEIETPELDQQLDQTRADLVNAQANLQISQATNKRYQDLAASNSVSREEVDTAAADLHAKQALVNSSEANVRRLEQLQAYEKIYAPFDGVVTARNIDIGSLIQTTDTRELFHLAAINKLRVYVSVPEIYAPQVKDGEKVSLTADSFPGENFAGTVVRNSDAIDTASRTLNVEVDVDNSSGKLLPGAYVFAHFKFPSASGSVTVPSNTLLFRSEGPRLGLVRDGHTKLVPVTIGHDYGTSLEILSGVTAEDEVILDPSDSLTDGMPVKVSGNNKTP